VHIPGEMQDPAVDARYEQGVAVDPRRTQYSYFVNSSAAPGFRRRGVSGPAGDAAWRVFVSSASGALAPYRQAAVEVCHRLGMIPVHMEEFDPQRPAPEQVCRREVESCDVFVLLLAHRYGARPPGQQLSYTELEYRCAVDRAGMPLLAFVVDPAFAWPPPDIDRGAEAQALARFAAQVRAERTVRRLAELAVFREDLLLALGRLQRTVPSAKDVAAGPDEPQREMWVPAPPEFYAVPPYVGGAPFTGRAGDLGMLDEWGRSADPVMVVEAIGGTGKSALTWQWTQDRAPAAVSGLAGRLWWSFYEGSASMTRFLQELVAYTSGRPMKQVRRLHRAELADQALTALRSRPYLLILDGFERLLAAYHRFDPSKLRDEDVQQDERSLIDPQADDIVHRLAAAGPSKILISTRLMPAALQGRFGQQMPGVRHLRLPGLAEQDVRALLARLDVHGSQSAIDGFFGPLGNHPLLVGIVAGLVRDYRTEPGGFDRWLADPTAGGAFHVPDLHLTQRRTHILAAALTGLQPGPRRLLGWISALSSAVSWTTLQAINPFQPEPPAAVEPDLTPLGPRPVAFDDESGGRTWLAARRRLRAQADRETQQQMAAWRSSEPVIRAKAQLDAALEDLERRGLLVWDRSSNSYDLHPIIRAYAYDQLEDSDRIQANDRIRDHFQSLPPEDPGHAASVEDLSQNITIFRALVGAGHIGAATALWQRFGSVLADDLGAYSTIIELLTPIARQGTTPLSTTLAGAYRLVGQYEEAARLETLRLADRLDRQDIHGVKTSLSSLSENLRMAGARAASSVYIDLWEALDTATVDQTDVELCIAHAKRAINQGRTRQARVLFNRAKELSSKSSAAAVTIEIFELYMTLREQSLTHAQLDDATSRIRSWLSRRHLAEFRCELFIQQGQFAQALAAAQECEQLGRSAGRDDPARSAFLLAKLGRISEATAAAEESLRRLPGLHPARRPHDYLARALWELSRNTEAVSHARDAYRQAWADGPPHCNHWDLRDARELLQTMGVPVPDLPTIDPATVTVPREHEIRDFIAALEAKRRNNRK
jgi:hypothetical protein